MTQAKIRIVILTMLVIGFAGGFMLWPIIMPPQPKATTATVLTPASPRDARGTQYFEVNIDEARQVVAACREGTVRGDECANAGTAVITVESKDRFRRFRGDR